MNLFDLETERLHLEKLNTNRDSEFILKLLNDPLWLKEIGDRNIRNLNDSANYIQRVETMYNERGIGSLAVRTKDSHEAIGIAGLLQRDGLDSCDIGFAFLTEFCGMGYGLEVGRGIIDHCKSLGVLKKLYAITNPSNERCKKLLVKLGFTILETKILPNMTVLSEIYVMNM